MTVRGGALRPVEVISEDQLRENGGNYNLSGTYAARIATFDEGEEGRLVRGGRAVAVYPVSQSDIDSGRFKIQGGSAVPVIDGDDIGREGTGRLVAIPVYDERGILGSGAIEDDSEEVPPTSAVINDGEETGGNPASTRKCDDATWDVQEDANGLNVEFSFSVKGNGSGFRVRGRGSTNRDYIVRAWNGSDWDEVDTISFDTENNTYTVDLDESYTIDDEVRVQVYRATGNNETLYMDCVAVLVDSGPSLTFTSDKDTISPTIVLSSGAPSPDWLVVEGDGSEFFYDTASFSHTRTDPAAVVVALQNTDEIASYITEINFFSEGITSTWSELHIERLVNLQVLSLGGNSSLTGDLSDWIIQSDIVNITFSDSSFSGDLSGWELPSGLTSLQLQSNSFEGDLSGWELSSGLTFFSLYSNSFGGDISSWVIPEGVGAFWIHDNLFSGAPVISSNIDISQYLYYDNGLSQADVDSVVEGIYNNRANFTTSSPQLNIGGDNAAPSGTYQDSDPPTTGKEYIYKLENDPDGEGFNTWSITNN